MDPNRPARALGGWSLSVIRFPRLGGWAAVAALHACASTSEHRERDETSAAHGSDSGSDLAPGSPSADASAPQPEPSDTLDRSDAELAPTDAEPDGADAGPAPGATAGGSEAPETTPAPPPETPPSSTEEPPRGDADGGDQGLALVTDAGGSPAPRELDDRPPPGTVLCEQLDTGFDPPTGPLRIATLYWSASFTTSRCWFAPGTAVDPEGYALVRFAQESGNYGPYSLWAGDGDGFAYGDGFEQEDPNRLPIDSPMSVLVHVDTVETTVEVAFEFTEERAVVTRVTTR